MGSATVSVRGTPQVKAATDRIDATCWVDINYTGRGRA
jgi:hypothetical protein